MFKYLRLFFMLCIVVYLHSCAHADDTNIKVTKNIGLLISKEKIKSNLNKYKNCLVLPIDMGCESCIEYSLHFIINNNNKYNIFIVTSQSSKILKSKLKDYNVSIDDLMKNSIIIDTTNFCFHNDISDVTPKLYKIKNGYIKSDILLYATNIHQDLTKIK